jgi:hypothetical protein
MSDPHAPQRRTHDDVVAPHRRGPDRLRFCDRYDVFAELVGRDFLRFSWPVGAADKAPFSALAGPAIGRPALSRNAGAYCSSLSHGTTSMQ